MGADPVEVAGQNYRVLLENERVRVLEYRAVPGDRTELHSHPDLVAIPLGPAMGRSISVNGEVVTIEAHPGEPMFMPAMDHQMELIGSASARVILVELK